MAKNKDYYRVLGVAPRSHSRTIEETYWAQAHELHQVPTRSAQKRLTLLNEAYETLGTPHRRDAYDRQHNGNSYNSEDGSGSGGTVMRTLLSWLTKPFRPD